MRSFLLLGALVSGTVAMLLLVISSLDATGIAPATERLLTTCILLSLSCVLAMAGVRLLGAQPPLFHRTAQVTLIVTFLVPLVTLASWLPLSATLDDVINKLVLPSLLILAVASNWNALVMTLRLPVGTRLATLRWLTVTLTELAALAGIISILTGARSIADASAFGAQILACIAIISGSLLWIIHRRHATKLTQLGL
jgi:hypothetical protein